MEELYEAAIAYYNNAPIDQKNLAKQFFQAMDADNSGQVTLQEYTDFLSENGGLATVDQNVFRELDKNGDGYLDFFEVLTLYYASQRETVSCDQCNKLLGGLHFTCVECFETPSCDTFDLCIKCYKEMAYSHEHDAFLDSYILLKSKRPGSEESEESESPLAQPAQPAQPPPQLPPQQPNHNNETSLSEAFEAFEIGYTVGTVAVAACTIM